MRKIAFWSAVVGTLVLPGCDAGNSAEPAEEHTVPASADATIYWEAEHLTGEDLDRARMDMGWRNVVEVDAADWEGDGDNPESWEDITAEAVNRGDIHLPLLSGASGPSVLRVQILLDRALFSPGVMDGRWGANTEKAVYWFQSREGLSRTGQVDRETFERLVEAAGEPRVLAREHRLSEDDVAGPFVEIPDSIYDKAELDCLCYESLSEKLGEMFHSTPELLEKLNPEKDLDALEAGQIIQVPNIRESDAGQGARIARLVVSDAGRYLHAVDSDDRIVFHFPSTLGARYDPSPQGDFRVVSITENPWWHYQPGILEHVDDDDEEALIPPGPNNAVGVVWMALSKEHYGIHGTSAPETIGYASSAGCVRLTNWDALFLSQRIDEGVNVSFRDTDGR